MVKSRRMEGGVDMALMRKRRRAYRISVGRPEGRKSLGISRLR
jgi:hypothetical protein